MLMPLGGVAQFGQPSGLAAENPRGRPLELCVLLLAEGESERQFKIGGVTSWTRNSDLLGAWAATKGQSIGPPIEWLAIIITIMYNCGPMARDAGGAGQRVRGDKRPSRSSSAPNLYLCQVARADLLASGPMRTQTKLLSAKFRAGRDLSVPPAPPMLGRSHNPAG